MTDPAVLAFATVVFVVLCATVRPSAAGGIAKVLHALAAVFESVWPWKRR